MTFHQLVDLPDTAIPLAETALLVACEEYPQLIIAPYLEVLDRYAETVRDRLGQADDPFEVVRGINEVLFDEEGFRGNREDYYDPRNSFLNDVIDRRCGIPITLSAIYLEVSRRLGFPVVGVGFPGHFLLKYTDGQREFFLDPYHGGEMRSREQCRDLLRDLHGGNIEFSDRYLGRVTNRQILYRLMNNLRGIYLKSQSFDKALAIVDMMILAVPEVWEHYRDRGLLLARMRRYREATEALGKYLEHRPDSEDFAEISEHLRNIRRLGATLN